jgi:hypothetical protein
MLDPGVQLVGWIKWLFAAAIAYDLNSLQQAAARASHRQKDDCRTAH